MENIISIVIEKKVITPLKTMFVIGPFDVGIATTVGCSLRRILLTSICGFSVYAVKIKGVAHEFVTLPNVNIDMQLIILNLKKLVIKSKNLDAYLANQVPITITCPLQKKGVIIAGSLKCPSDFEIVNQDFVIFETLADDAVEIELLVRYGRGFESFTSDIKLIKNCPPTFFPIQAIYSPIKNVSFEVHEHVTKSNIKLNNLEITVTTNGSLTGNVALNMACQELINLFTHMMTKKEKPQGGIIPTIVPPISPPVPHENENDTPIEKLNIGSRVQNALRKENIMTIGDILKKTKIEIRQINNLGDKSLEKLFAALESKNIDVSFLK